MLLDFAKSGKLNFSQITTEGSSTHKVGLPTKEQNKKSRYGSIFKNK